MSLFTRVATAALLMTASQATAAEWSNWVSRDGPSGSGDWELVADLYSGGYIGCTDPIGFEARRASDQVAAQNTGEVISLSLAGFICLKANQPDGACANYQVRALCPDASDGSWSDWLNRDSPGGSGDYERANTDGAGGRLSCTAPIAIQTRRASDQLDMIRTGEVYSFWGPGTSLNGFTCYTAHQPDGICDDYETRYFCPPVGYSGEIDMGDFTVVFDPDDLVEQDGAFFVSTGFEIWFDTIYLSFDASSTLQLVEVDGALQLEGAVVGSTPTSNLPLFGVLDLMPGAGVDILLGYGSGALLEDLEAPLNPAYKFLFLQFSAGTAEFGGVEVEAPGAVSITLAIAPDPVTVYANLGGFFPQMGPITLDEVGIGFSVADGLAWSPAATWQYEDDMVAQTGNVWLNATIGYGINDIASLNFAGELLADVDFDAVANGQDGLEMLAFNGNVNLSAGVSIFSITQEIADMSVLYVAATNRWIAICESANLTDSLVGPAAWLNLSTTAKIAVEFQNDAFVSMMIQGDVSVDPAGTPFTIGNATIEATPAGATLTGNLDLLVATLAVSGAFYEGGFELTGESTAAVAGGFYEVRVRGVINPGGVAVALGARGWDFGQGAFGDWLEVSAAYAPASGWCANITALTVCLDPSGNLTLGGDLGDQIDMAISEGWSVVSNAVVDTANTLVEDAAGVIDWLLNGGCRDASYCGANEWCDLLGYCQPKWSNDHVCASDVECQSTHCVAGFCRECSSHANCGNNEWCDAAGFCQPEWSNGHVCASNIECQSTHCVAGFCRECSSDAHCSGSDWCDAGGTCQPLWNNGHACLSNSECQSGWCDAFFCRAKLSNGTWCTSNGQCASNHCSLGCQSIFSCGLICN